MENSGKMSGSRGKRTPVGPGLGQLSPQHYLRLIVHRKWLIVTTFLVVTAATAGIAAWLPDIYTSETVILVDPQKVPENYVRPTVTGDIRNRLGTLEQQILSATRLQKIIDDLKLYPEARKTQAREEIIARMRKDISVTLVSNFGSSQELQAFRIRYSGKQPRLVAQVANELASQFIEENLKAREQQATGTTQFLENQLQETRKTLEEQETKLRDYKLKHIGEMPEQQNADLQILGQLQSQLQLVGEALARAEQQRSVAQAMLSQSTPVLDIDDGEVTGPSREGKPGAKAPAISPKAKLVAALTEKLNRGYTEDHPDIKLLRAAIADEEAKEASQAKTAATVAESVPSGAAAARKEAAAAPEKRRPPVVVPPSQNPVLLSQIHALDSDIAKQRAEQQRLREQVTSYQGKLEAIPVREQEVTDLVRDYETSKAHYAQLLEKQLSAETATQLEIRQKGETFSILDPAQPAEKPSKPNRPLIDAAGGCGGLILGLLLALSTEFFGMSITGGEQLAEATGAPLLEVIPMIFTQADRRARRFRLLWASVSGLVVTILAGAAVFFYRYRV